MNQSRLYGSVAQNGCRVCVYPSASTRLRLQCRLCRVRRCILNHAPASSCNGSRDIIAACANLHAWVQQTTATSILTDSRVDGDMDKCHSLKRSDSKACLFLTRTTHVSLLRSKKAPECHVSRKRGPAHHSLKVCRHAH